MSPTLLSSLAVSHQCTGGTASLRHHRWIHLAAALLRPAGIELWCLCAWAVVTTTLGALSPSLLSSSFVVGAVLSPVLPPSSIYRSTTSSGAHAASLSPSLPVRWRTTGVGTGPSTYILTIGCGGAILRSLPLSPFADVLLSLPSPLPAALTDRLPAAAGELAPPPPARPILW